MRYLACLAKAVVFLLPTVLGAEAALAAPVVQFAYQGVLDSTVNGSDLAPLIGQSTSFSFSLDLAAQDSNADSNNGLFGGLDTVIPYWNARIGGTQYSGSGGLVWVYNDLLKLVDPFAGKYVDNVLVSVIVSQSTDSALVYYLNLIDPNGQAFDADVLQTSLFDLTQYSSIEMGLGILDTSTVPSTFVSSVVSTNVSPVPISGALPLFVIGFALVRFAQWRQCSYGRAPAV